MLRIRPARDRGHADHGWLSTYHTFSFACLRVINDDTVQPGQGFGTHGHEDMEILSYVVNGALEHKDSMGTGSVLRAGDVQRMSAGRGVTHSEFNHSASNPLRFLQIWVLPQTKGIEPGYEERHFDENDKLGRLRLIVSPDGSDDSLRMHQDVRVYASILQQGNDVQYELSPSRHAWVQVVRGRVAMNDHELGRGDGAAISDETRLRLEGLETAEILLFDLK